MSGRTLPVTFDLRTQLPIRQELDHGDELFLEAKVPGVFEKLRAWSISKKPQYYTLWRHDWQEALFSIGVDGATTASILEHLTTSNTPMTIVPLDQGACDSCWAIAISTSLTDRFRIAYQDPNFPVLSPTTLMVDFNSSQEKHCCHGNVTNQASACTSRSPLDPRCPVGGLETWCCTPYEQGASCEASYQSEMVHRTPTCEDGNGMLGTASIAHGAQCSMAYSRSKDSRYFTVPGSSGVIRGNLPFVIQEELLARGTVIGDIILYPDYQNQCAIKSKGAFEETGGVYLHSECFPRYRADFKKLVDRVFVDRYNGDLRMTTLRNHFNRKIEPFQNDLSELWTRAPADISAHFEPYENNLAFLQCGFYGLNDQRYMPRHFIGDLEEKYGQHALTVLGWGVQKNVSIPNYGVTLDIPYWICRNSYGDRWCGDGYVKIGLSSYSHIYPDQYMFSDLLQNLGLERVHYGTGTGLSNIKESRSAVCAENTVCGGASSPGVPDLQSSNWTVTASTDNRNPHERSTSKETMWQWVTSRLAKLMNSKIRMSPATFLGILVVLTTLVLLYIHT